MRVRKYDDEFKQTAVRKILDGQSVASASRELGIGESLLHKWKKLRLDSSSDVGREVVELRKRLKEVEMEPDILKLQRQRVAWAGKLPIQLFAHR